jgi:hypothetical protein
MLECDRRASLSLKELYLLQQRVGKAPELTCFLGAIAGVLSHWRNGRSILYSL